MSEERSDNRGTKPGEAATPQPHGGAIGQKPHERTQALADKIRRLAGLQISQADIAMALSISEDTIQRHYPTEWTEGKAAKAVLAKGTAYALALGVPNDPEDMSKGWKIAPDPKVLMFLLERQFGMADTKHLQHSGEVKGGGVVNIGHLSTEALRELAGIAIKDET